MFKGADRFKKKISEIRIRVVHGICGTFRNGKVDSLIIRVFYLNSNFNFGILPVLVFQLKVYYMNRGATLWAFFKNHDAATLKLFIGPQLTLGRP